MLRERLERAAQAHRHADADQKTPEHHRADVVRGAEHPRARRRDEQKRGAHATRAVAVEQHAGRNLRARETKKVKARQQPEIGGGQAELARDERREAEIHAAKDVRNEIADREQREHAKLHEGHHDHR